MPTTFDGFEDSDVSDWTNNSGSFSSSSFVSYSGSYSAQANENNSNTELNIAEKSWSLGQVKTVRFYYYEYSNNNSCGLGLKDGNGDTIIGAGTENPQYTIVDGNGYENTNNTPNTSYKQWIEVEFTFDWSGGTVDVAFTPQSSGGGQTYTARPLGGTQNPSTVNIGTMESGDSTEGFWIDEIQRTSAPTNPQNLTASSSSGQIDLSWDGSNFNGDDGHYDVYRGTSSGSHTQLAQVSKGTTTYTDTAVAEGEKYFYVVDATNNSGTSSDSNEASAITPLSEPTNFSIDSGGSSFDVTWTNNTSDAFSIDVEYRIDGGSYTVHDTLSPSSTFDTVPINSSGTYDIRAVAVTDHIRSPSTAATADVLNRNPTSYISPSVAATTRSGISKSRSATSFASSNEAQIRTRSLNKPRTPTSFIQLSEAVVTRQPKTMTRTADSHIGRVFATSNVIFSDLFKDGVGDYDATYVSDEQSFVTEWIYEEPIQNTEHLAVRLQSSVETGPIRVAVERDDSGDGSVDARSEWIELEGGRMPTTIPDIDNDEAYYRVIIYGPDVRFDDHIRGLDIGFVH